MGRGGDRAAVTQGHEWPDLEVGTHSFIADWLISASGASVSGWNR